jgi:hypothetical protein
MNIYQNAAKHAKDEGSDQISERRLWTAVLLQALEDWKSTNMRRKAEAEKFLFQSGPDFAKVCVSAGLAPDSVITKLERMKKTLAQPLVRFPYAA